MKKFIFFTLSFILLLTGFSIKFINEFDIFKDELLTKYELETKTTSLYLQENIKKYLEDKDTQILNKINSIFNDNFSSIQIEKGNFTITEKELIDLTNNLDKNLAWELTNLQIDENLGQILQTTQSDDLQKELLTIEGSIPNELNKNLVPSSDIYTFIPNKNFRNISSLTIKFDATNQLDETINSNATITFDKNISNFINQNNTIVPKWFKDLIPIYIEEQSNNVSNGFTSNATIYLNTNVEKVYIELYEKTKKEFFSNLLWFCVAFLGLIGLWFLYRLLVK
ncbi:hypothetical protein [Aliarcobacter lanthieri]|uniref:hypothetical protein n=1 Tax=Aliarcobacter lanthieri TaxID=1355374 RepID=UPI000A81854E|nr:hypothetical protein [Aliarcobacter lanthieri]QKF58732.1 putative membrane protein [Aliarcobacter lanthieri]